MRDRDAIDAELRLLLAVAREHGALPSIGPVDALLDERAKAHRPLTRLTALAPGQRPGGV